MTEPAAETSLAQDERVAMLRDAQRQSRLMLLHDADVRRALVDFEGRVFHYVVNRAGANLLWVVVLLLLGTAVAIGITTGAPTLPWRMALVSSAALSVALGSFIWRWRRVAQTSFIALNDTHIYLGDNKRAWRIAWDLLDAASMGFHTFDAGAGQGVLQLNVSGQQIPMQLYHPLLHIDDLQGLMVELLHHLPDTAQAHAGREDSEGDEAEESEAEQRAD